MHYSDIPEEFRMRKNEVRRFDEKDGFLLPFTERQKAIQWAKDSNNSGTKLRRTHSNNINNLKAIPADKQKFTPEADSNTYSLLSIDGKCIALADIVLGVGTNGYVKLAQDLETGELLAVKVEFLIQGDDKPELYYSNLEHERFIYNQRNQSKVSLLQRANITAKVRTPDLKKQEPRMGIKRYLPMKFILGQTLFQFTSSNKDLPLAQKKQIAIELIMNLQSLHDQGIVHADLSPLNMMICKTSEKFETHIIDLGAALHCEINEAAFKLLENLDALKRQLIQNPSSSVDIKTLSKQLTMIPEGMQESIILTLLYLHGAQNIVKQILREAGNRQLQEYLSENDRNDMIYDIMDRISKNTENETAKQDATSFKMLLNAFLGAVYREKTANGTKKGDAYSLAFAFEEYLFSMHERNDPCVKKCIEQLEQGRLAEAQFSLQDSSELSASAQPYFPSERPRHNNPTDIQPQSVQTPSLIPSKIPNKSTQGS